MLVGISVAKKKRGPKPRPGEQRLTIITMRCRQEYRDWLVGFARKERLTPTQLIDFGLVEIARVRGYDPPPER